MITSTPIVDLLFRIQGTRIAVDHGYALYSAISRLLEPEGSESWLHEADNVGLLLVRGQYDGRGSLLLNKDSRFGVRLPADQIPRFLTLAGKCLRVREESLRVGVCEPRALVPAPGLFARLVTTKHGEEEGRFDAEISRQLEALGIGPSFQRGRRRVFTVRDRRVVGFSLLVTDLTPEQSLLLQQQGLGGRRKLGCGVFFPADEEMEAVRHDRGPVRTSSEHA